MPRPSPLLAPEPVPNSASSTPVDTAEMWENLCRADELFEECEALARGREAGATPGVPDDAAPRCDPAG